MAHRHDAGAASQNVGNSIGTRSSVRQSRLFREYESGNTMKNLLGTPDLAWDTNQKQGAYSGPVFDGARAGAHPTATAQSRSHAPSGSAAPHVLSKGDVVVRNGEQCVVVGVDFACAPPSYTVQRPDGSEVGTEASRLTLVAPQSQAGGGSGGLGAGSGVCPGFAAKRPTGPLSRRCMHCGMHADDHR